jgi:hypothetical protein
MRYIAIWGLIASLIACQAPLQPKLAPVNNQEALEQERSKLSQNLMQEEETDTITIPMKEHSFQLRLKKDELLSDQLSSNQVKKMSEWWDSLPAPVRDQIQQNQVDIQVVSNVRTKPSGNTAPADAQVEKTGEALERIIGKPTDMTYAVNTISSHQDLASQDEQETTIILSKKMAVKLSEYQGQISLRQDRVSQENLQTLQYWWLSLPEQLKEKIRRKELYVDLVCYAIDHQYLDKTGGSMVGLSGEKHLLALSEVLQELVGFQANGKRQEPLGKINTANFIEKSRNQPQGVLYQIKIQLKPIKKQSNTIQIQ